MVTGSRDARRSSAISKAANLYSKDRPTKRSAPAERSTASKRIKTEDLRVKKNPRDKYKPMVASATGPQQPDYELSPLMTNIVEDELDLLMNKINESFPKEITNEAERVVYDKYRGQVGAALRNTIGLNITKRLLNVHDRLLVKLTFAHTPGGKDLDKFIINYKLTNFKKVTHQGNTYVADLKSYTDLDKLCSVKKLSCGSIVVTVKPCIPFMKCPHNLKTVFKSSSYIHTEQKQTDTQSENILKPSTKQQTTELETEITTKDDNKTKNTQINKVKAIESKESNAKPKSQEVTKATTQNKSQETSKVTGKSQGSNKVTVNTKASNIQTQEAVKTQAKPETLPKVNTTPTKADETSKAKTTAIKTEAATQLKTTAIKTEKTTPTKTEETPKAITTSVKTEAVATKTKIDETKAKTEATATITKIEETNAKTTGPKTDTDKPKTIATNTKTTTTKTTTTKPESTPKIKTTPTKSEEIAKAKTSETAKVNTTVTKTDITQVKTTPRKTESTPNVTTPVKTLETPKTNNVTPKTQGNKMKTQNEINETTTKETPQAKQVNTTKTKPEVNKTTVTKKDNVNKDVKKGPERKKRESDFDELDDQDILAMLSGGIILDECSGSDDD